MHATRLVPLVLIFALVLAAPAAWAADKPSEQKKQTRLGLYVTAAEADDKPEERQVHALVVEGSLDLVVEDSALSVGYVPVDDEGLLLSGQGGGDLGLPHPALPGIGAHDRIGGPC